MDASGVNALNRVLSDYALPEQKKAPGNELGRDAFLRLLIAQLENQDPTNPQENGEFVAQLAQFSQLEESQKMSIAFELFSSTFQSTQHLQATSLVGRAVHVESSYTQLGESEAISVMAQFDDAVQAASLHVYDQAGTLVDSFELGPQEEGRREFIWTGYDGQDERFPPGVYHFEVTASQGGESGTVPLYLSATVNSVTIENNGKMTLNLAAIGPRSMTDVVQIN